MIFIFNLCPFLSLTLILLSQMYSEGSKYVHQNNDTALHYFKKAADLVRIFFFPVKIQKLLIIKCSLICNFCWHLFREIRLARVASVWLTCMEGVFLW